MKKLITILEDDRDIRELCAYILAGEGFFVQSFGSIKDFCLSTTSPNLYLLDIQLPDGNGLDVCEKLKNSEKDKATPIIMMSAHLNKDKMPPQSKADDFMQKPFDIDLLVKKVKALIH